MTTRILIIEDNHTNIELMVYLLDAFGYNLIAETDGEKGLETALRDRPDLIICDLEMPGMNGYEVARNLREQSSPPIPIIAVTAYAMVGDRDRVLASGFDGYLSKPIYPETFVSQVEVFLPPHKRSTRVLESHDLVSSPAPDGQLSRAVVLVVDDSPVNLNLIRSTLEPSGYSVVAVDTVQAAIDRAQYDSIDLIVSDLHMSPESGLFFLRHVKADPGLKSIPFIMLTASVTDPADPIEAHAVALGAAKFLARPIAPEQLLQEIELCLTTKEPKRAKGSEC